MRDCPSRKMESQGQGPQPYGTFKNVRVTTKQVRGTLSERENPDDPTFNLDSNSEEERGVRLVTIKDQGSKPQGARVLIGGVAAWGVVDSGADITIMGKELFKQVASVCMLRKRDFKKPDRIPKTYDRTTFSLDGRMSLEIEFEGNKMNTTIYVKMDAYDQLLLSEGVCRQLGIVQYHPAVRPWTERRRGPGVKVGQKSDTEVDAEEVEDLEDRSTSIVPTLRVKLLQTVSILPRQRTTAMVKIVGDTTSSRSLLLDPTAAILQGVSLDAGLLHTKDGIACLELANHSGYTQHLAKGTELGEAMEAEVVTSEDLSYESL